MKKWTRDQRIVNAAFDATEMITWKRDYLGSIHVVLHGGGYGTTATIDCRSFHFFISQFINSSLLWIVDRVFSTLEAVYEEEHRYDEVDPIGYEE